MTVVANLLITLNLALFPFLAGLIMKGDLKRQSIQFYIGRYILVAFASNMINICLFSFYRSDSIGNSLLYLIEKLNVKYIIVASIVNIVSLILFRIIKISFTFDLVYKRR
jgi:uncharacterized membrane protein